MEDFDAACSDGAGPYGVSAVVAHAHRCPMRHAQSAAMGSTTTVMVSRIGLLARKRE